MTAEVRLESFGLAPGRPDGGDHGFRAPAAGAVVNQHAGSVLGEAFGDGGANAAGCSGDEGDFVLEWQGRHDLGLLRGSRGQPTRLASVGKYGLVEVKLG